MRLSTKLTPYATSIDKSLEMPPSKVRFSLDEQREVFFSSAPVSRAIRYAADAGRVRQLGPRLYTKNLDADPAEICRRNWVRIAAGYFPGAVVAGRTAFDFKPANDGSVFLDAERLRDLRLPGLWLRPAAGRPPTAQDQRLFGEEIYMSSRPRAFLENLRPSRSRGGAIRRTLTRRELEEQLELYGRVDPLSLNRLRDEARALAPTLGLDVEMALLDGLIGAILGTREVSLASPRARAGARGTPYDPHRVARFEELATALQRTGLPECASSTGDDLSAFAFFEAYFSNYIEGTEFTVKEAEDIVFGGALPAQRPQDAHDILGTYQLVADRHQRGRVPASADMLIDILTGQHRAMLAQRPEIGPGQFKQQPNHVGGREFVAPRLVEGTLREGWRIYESLALGFARAAFAMFLVSEVHPFADGNGRTGRLLMNAELTAAAQQRIIVTTRDRGDYLAGLRGLSINANAESYIRILARLQEATAATDYSTLAAAEANLTVQRAFTDADAGDDAVGGLLGIAGAAGDSAAAP